MVLALRAYPPPAVITPPLCKPVLMPMAKHKKILAPYLNMVNITFRLTPLVKSYKILYHIPNGPANT